MKQSMQSLLATGSKIWLDSVDPEAVGVNRAMGISGATSNPIIVSDVIASGQFDRQIERFIQDELTDPQIAWKLTDLLVADAEKVFLPVWEASRGDDGYVSFELDPLLEDPEQAMPHPRRVAEYITLGQQWAFGHENRLIKVPATPAGLEALETLAATGVSVNVTLIFTPRQYRMARSAIWRGAQRRDNLNDFKSVYSIFVSRLDVYTEKAVPELSPEAQGMVGILNAKRMWAENNQFWADKQCPLKQEIVFASTGAKKASDKPWKYVEAFAGGDILTNPPATNQAVAESGLEFVRQIDRLPPPRVCDEIDALVDMDRLEKTLMQEGIEKFATPLKKLLGLIADKRAAMLTSTLGGA